MIHLIQELRRREWIIPNSLSHWRIGGSSGGRLIRPAAWGGSERREGGLIHPDPGHPAADSPDSGGPIGPESGEVSCSALTQMLRCEMIGTWEEMVLCEHGATTDGGRTCVPQFRGQEFAVIHARWTPSQVLPRDPGRWKPLDWIKLRARIYYKEDRMKEGMKTVGQLAKDLSVSKSAVWHAIKRNDVPTKKLIVDGRLQVIVDVNTFMERWNSERA